MSSTDSDHGSFRQYVLEFTAAFEALIHLRRRGGSKSEQERYKRRMHRIRRNHFHSDDNDSGHRFADSLRSGVFRHLLPR